MRGIWFEAGTAVLRAVRSPLARADEALEHAAQPGVLKVMLEVSP